MNKKIKMILSTLSPKLTTRLMYFYNFKKPLHLKNPQSINEKLQYLKLITYNNNETITQCVDKYLVRNYLEERRYADLLPALIGGPYTAAEDICKYWNEFPDKFVIKCNHGCGYNIIVNDKNSVDIDAVVGKLDHWLREDYWKVYCEPQYKSVPKRILVEEHLGKRIEAYKFCCFNSRPEFLYVSYEDDQVKYVDYIDLKWNRLPVLLGDHPHSPHDIKKPENFNDMIALAKELSSGFPFVRIDLYNVCGKIYFSEFTFIPTGGNLKLNPESTFDEWGKLLEL